MNHQNKLFKIWMSNPLFRTSILLLIFILPATVVRLALINLYPDDFGQLSFNQVITALLVGLRFDISMGALFIGIPLLLLFFPFKWVQHRYWQNFWLSYIFIAWLFFILLMIIDTIYFGQVHRHVGAEINTLNNDLGAMFALAVSNYRLAILLFLLCVPISVWLLRIFLRYPSKQPKHPWRQLLIWPVLFSLLLLAQRGNYSGKPIGVGEAFFSDSISQGYLAMNGAFAISRAIVEKQPDVRLFMPQIEAVSITRDQLSSPNSPYLNIEYPLLRKVDGTISSKPNVVVLMLESWGALHIDSIRRQNNLPPLGVTPNFDKLVEQGRLYTHFYANGQRSIQGAAAILASQPTLPSMSVLGLGMEHNRLSFLGDLGKSEKYETIFLQSSDRGSFHFDSIAARAGFDKYFGAEDIKNLHEFQKPASTWGTWDHNTFQAANQLFASAKKPFIGFIFTSTTHTPWLIPDSRWKKYTGASDRDAFLNTLFYADWALGELIAAAKKEGYFDNTIFIITADHANEFVEQPEFVPNQFHIPLLIVGPGIKPGLDDRPGSQVDIIPTIVDLARWKTPYAALGRSLIDNTRIGDRAAFTVRGNVIDWISKSGWVSHNLDRSVGKSNRMTQAEVDLYEKRLLATYQTTIDLQLQNRFLPLKEK